MGDEKLESFKIGDTQQPGVRKAKKGDDAALAAAIPSVSPVNSEPPYVSRRYLFVKY